MPFLNIFYIFELNFSEHSTKKMLKHIKESHINKIQENESKKGEEKDSAITAKKKRKNKSENNADRAFGMKPQCILCKKHDENLVAVAVGNFNEEFTSFAEWYCLECIPEQAKSNKQEYKKINEKKRKKEPVLLDYAVSSKRTQQKRRKTLRETTVLMAANPKSEVQLLKDTFEVISDKLVVTYNVYSTLNIMKNNENVCPVVYKSVATCLTANLSLNDALKISGINYSTISKYRKKLNDNKLFVQ